MTNYRSERSVGARIRAIRKARGIRTTRELAERIKGTTVTESIIENIESGRKVNLDVSLLLNIAMALDVPPTYLLAPIGEPGAPIDLPNLSDAFDGMTAEQFDAWLTATNDITYHPTSSDSRYARLELEALRELSVVEGEIVRLEAIIDLERDYASDTMKQITRARLDNANSESAKLRKYLLSSGWAISDGEASATA